MRRRQIPFPPLVRYRLLVQPVRQPVTGELELRDRGRAETTAAVGAAQLRYAKKKKKKVNTAFRQDGPAACLPSDTSGLVLGLSHRRAGSRAARVAQRGHEAVGSAGDERHRVHRAPLFTFRAVRRNAANSKRLGGGNDLANSGMTSLPGTLRATECFLRGCHCHSGFDI